MNIKKVFNILFDVLFYIFIACIAIFLFSSFRAKTNGTTPSVFGYSFYSVLTGSMEPTIKTGSIVVVKNANANEIEDEDIITFKAGNKGTLVTHRVKEIVNNGNVEFVTQGDANNTVDGSIVTSENLVGKVVLAIPFMGTASVFIKNNIVPILILFFTIIIIVTYIKYILKKKN